MNPLLAKSNTLQVRSIQNTGRIADIDVNKDIYLVNVHTDKDMFSVNDLDGSVGLAAKETINAAAITVSTASTITVSVAIATTTTTATITDVEVTLAQALAELKSAKPKAIKVVIQEPEQVNPIKRLEQIRLDEELAFKLQAENAKIKADYPLAQRLQAQEQKELTDKEKARLFIQFLDQRRKHFAA
ncbi:hypothetical protein Tco_0583452 [Tanacetum coccineum]